MQIGLLENKNHRIVWIDSLRGLAILLVLVNHFLAEWNMGYPTFYIGSTGVDLFFIISGFVIPFSLFRNKNIGVFLSKRLKRLYPVFLVCLSVTLFFYFLNKFNQSFPDVKTILFNMTMIPEIFNIRPVDPSYWTLAVEWEFYVLVAIVIYFFDEKAWNVVGIIILIFSYVLNGVIDKWLEFSEVPALVLHYFRYVRYHALFFAGYIFYRIYLGKARWFHFLLLGLCFYVQCSLFPRMYDNAGLVQNKSLYIVFLSAYFLIFLMQSFYKRNLIVLNNAFLHFVGKISYPLYLLHQYVGRFVMMPLLLEVWHVSFIMAFILSFLVVVFLSYLVHEYMERRLLRVF